MQTQNDRIHTRHQGAFGCAVFALPYVLVAQCDAALAKAVQLGAQQLVPATDIPQIGRFAIVADPTGAAIAFMNRA